MLKKEIQTGLQTRNSTINILFNKTLTIFIKLLANKSKLRMFSSQCMTK